VLRYKSPVRRLPLGLLIAAVSGTMLVPLGAQRELTPSARLTPAPRLVMPSAVDSNVAMTWTQVDGASRLVALTSWGGIPALLAGPDLERLQRVGDVTIAPHPGHGIWIESVIPDETDSTWYGYYHHEVPADRCGRHDRAIPTIGAARSTDRGLTWQDLGIILEAPPDSDACLSPNRFVVGGVGDVSVMIDDGWRDLYLFFSGYSKDPSGQGVLAARLAWADRDQPKGRVTVWQEAVWLPPRRIATAGTDSDEAWEYPAGTPLTPVSKPWHDGSVAADAFWGPSLHWNTHLEQYVMLLNRTKDESFNNEGIYASYARTLADPAAWSAPRKIMNGGGWYPQVAGLEPAAGTDKRAGARARLFLTGRSEHYIEFTR